MSSPTGGTSHAAQGRPPTADREVSSHMSPGPVARVLAEFAATLHRTDIPEEVAGHALWCFLDAVGVAFASSRYPFAVRARNAIARLRTPGSHPVLAGSERVSFRDAVLLNGILVHGLDYDDTHIGAVVHPSASALPAALGSAVELHRPGHELLVGYVVGVEVATRIGVAAAGGFHHVGFHPTGVAGAFGAATAAARIHGLDVAGIARAQGFVGSLASGTQEFLSSGAWTKRVHGGWAAVAGVVATAFAAEEFVSPESIYEGRFGLFATHLPNGHAARLEDVTADLGQRWESTCVEVKRFPVCHFSHACIEAMLALRAAGLRAEDVESITCRVPLEVVNVVCEPKSVKARPTSDYEAAFSLPFGVAAALAHGRVGLKELHQSVREDPAVLAIVDRIDYWADSGSEFPRSFPGEVVVRTYDGRTLRERRPGKKGSTQSTAHESTVVDKFRSNLGFAGMSARATTRVYDAVMSMDRWDDAASLAEQLRM